VKRRKLIDRSRAVAFPEHGNPPGADKTGLRANVPRGGPKLPEPSWDGSTTSFAVADQSGNVVQATPTHGGLFGTGVVVGKTGLLFNNGTRIGSTSPYPDDVNYVRGGQIPILNNSPTIIMKDGTFYLAIGTPGGETIGQTEFQAIVNVLDFGMNIQEAVAAPRFVLTADPNFYRAGSRIRLNLESRYGPELARALEAMGHEVRLAPGYSFGSMNGILRDPVTGTLFAGADPRRVGYAVGW
jgi:gamma-glutamyltranspeptidase/glutathione hydrolase